MALLKDYVMESVWNEAGCWSGGKDRITDEWLREWWDGSVLDGLHITVDEWLAYARLHIDDLC